ncbi:hypothetical protein EZS27_007552 [termite gut metagenome]|uniref:CMP/dCMP-type deaminase domain-containing protein n=1 Tax=termite gut metagenome TaxID=433724 RepID=A0A5J4SGB8_9ZZZZ
MSEIIDKIYELRSSFVVIGLTGRTGSGCSSAAKLLSAKKFDEFNAPSPEEEDNISNEDRKYRIVYNYLNENWHEFTIIQASDIITFFVLQHSYDDFMNSFAPSKYKENPTFKDDYKKLHEKAKKTLRILDERKTKLNITGFFDSFKNELERFKISITDEVIVSMKKVFDQQKKETHRFLFLELHDFTTKIKEYLHENKKCNSYKEYQQWGDNIRFYGKAIHGEKDNIDINPSLIAKYINLCVKFLRDYHNDENMTTYVVIDALRNPYEILYFRERYSAFYTLSINVEEEDRITRLENLGFTLETRNELDEKEYPEKKKIVDSFGQQNIQHCIELSDIHINNPQLKDRNLNEMKKQLVHYVSLITHPGIVQPTRIERVMQIAYSAKINSSCLSRQVGAAVTDKNFSVKSIGWNNTPEGQTPCLLRNFDNLYNKKEGEAYSQYELNNNEFRKTLSEIKNKVSNNYFNLKGRNFSYCFKDFQNYTELKKNQVHTRSLHAEENAFLQIAKYGGISLTGGKLFTTASPCELCAKKAYQLGIEEIYYIDPYPGISVEHILKCGIKKPKLILFRGAIGRAYFHLYHPMLSHKDELSELLHFDIGAMIDERDGCNK